MAAWNRGHYTGVGAAGVSELGPVPPPRPLYRRVRPVDLEVQRPAKTVQHHAPAPVKVERDLPGFV